MSRRGKLRAEEKLELVQGCLRGELSQVEAAKLGGVTHSSIQMWIMLYQMEGVLGLGEKPKNQRYSKDLKQQAVKKYVSGNESIRAIRSGSLPPYGTQIHESQGDFPY